ncbi:MAG: alpha/beta hydrolase [Rhodospirillaceae bacterium]
MRIFLGGIISALLMSWTAHATDWVYETIPAEDGVPLVVAETGNPDGPSILFIHGFSQSILSWKMQLDDPGLQSKYRMVAFDLRGHGASGKPWTSNDYESRDWGSDVAAVIATKNLDKPVLVGWSFGGSVMTAYLRHHGMEDVSGLIFAAGAMSLSDSTSFSAEMTAEQAEMMSRMGMMMSPDVAQNLEGTSAFVESLSAEPLDSETQREALVYNMMMPAYARVAMFANQTSYEDLAGKITLPTLLIHGDADAVVDFELSVVNQGLIPGSELARYEGIGHAPFLEDPARFNKDVATFTDRVNTPK